MPCDAELLRLDEIEGAETSWLWPDRIPVGHVTVVAGEAASGKSLLAAELAARVSSGEAWPDAPECGRRPTGSVVIAQSERHLHAVVKRRLLAAGANPRQVALVERDGELPEGMTPAEVLLGRLENALDQVGDCSLVIVDHLPGWLRTTNPRANERAEVFDRLADFAARRRIALVVVWRLEKTAPGGAARALDALMTAAPVVWMLARDPYRGDTYRAVCAQNQLGCLPENLAFRVEGDRLVWQAPQSQATADEIVAATARSVDRYERRQAGRWLLELLAEGPIEAGRLWEEARQCRLSERTVRRAAAELDLHPMKSGQRGPWLWGYRAETLSSQPTPDGARGHDEKEAVVAQAACEATPENVAALESLGSLPDSAVLDVQLRRDASPSMTIVAQTKTTNGPASEAAAQTEETSRQAAGETSGDGSASQSVAALETAGSLGTSEATPEVAAKAEKHRLRKLRREKRRREYEALLEFHNLLRNG